MNHRVRSLLTASLCLMPLAPALAQHHPCGNGLGFWHAPPGYAADFASPVGLLGLWREASGDVIAPEPKVLAAHLDCPVGVPCLVNNPGDGRSIRDFERYSFNGNLYYGLAFQDVERFELLLPSIADAADFNWQLWFQGLGRNHLVDFETFYESGTRRWAALFQPGFVQQQLDLDMSAAELESRVEDAPSSGVLPHLVDFELLNFSFGLQRYAALFDDADIEQRFFGNLTVEEFHETVHDLRLEGFYLTDVETWLDPMSDQFKFAAVFEAGNGGDHLFVMACDENTFKCDDPAYVKHLNDHLVSRTVKLPDENPSVRLIDIEYPRSNAEDVIGSFGEGVPAATSRRVRRPETQPLGLPVNTVPPPPTCTHAGVLHDAGTNGPP